MIRPVETVRRAAHGATQTARSAFEAVGGAARTTFYAGLGLVATLQEEASKVFESLVREGRAVEAGRVQNLTASTYRDAKEDLSEARSDAAEVVRDAEASAEAAGQKARVQAKALEERVAEVLTATLQRMNVPTREDIEALKRSVERLDRKAAELRAA